MELTLEAVAKDAFRRDFFLRCFSEREAQALELRLSFLHRVRQYKRLVGRRDLLPRAAKDIATSYLQTVESTDQLLLPPSAEALRAKVLHAVTLGYCPLDLFCGMETLVRSHLTREAFPKFLRSNEYLQLCDALRARRELPLAEVLVDSRRTQFLMKFISQEFPGEEGNLRFWVHVQTRFLPLIQTTLFSVALFEEVQRHVRHVFNRFLVASPEQEGDDASNAVTKVPEDVKRATLQQIMRLQNEAFSPPRYANLFRAAQDCVWEWLQSVVYPKFRASTLYVLLVVETEDLEADRQLRRLSEHVQATVRKSTAVKQERQSETIPKLSTRKSGTQLKSNAVLVPIHQRLPRNTWGQGEGERSKFSHVLVVHELAEHGIRSISVASMLPLTKSTENMNQVNYELFCAGDQQKASEELHPTQLNFWLKNDVRASLIGNPSSPTKRASPPSAPKPAFHDFVLPRPSETDNDGHLYCVCLTVWRRQNSLEEQQDSVVDASTLEAEPASPSKNSCLFYPRFFCVVSTRPTYNKSRRLLLQLATNGVDNLTEIFIAKSVASAFATNSTSNGLQLRAKYDGFYLQPFLPEIDFPLHNIFKEMSSQTYISILASILAGKSIVMVSEHSSTVVLIGEALREFLKPFQLTHFYLPLCPAATAMNLCNAGIFAKANSSPFLLGFEGVLTYQKKDSGSDQRYRIRNNLYNIHKVSLQLQSLPSSGSDAYPPDLLETPAIVIDIDADDVYMPEKVEIPELPQSQVRSLESAINTAVHSARLVRADSHLFNPSKGPNFMTDMLAEPKENESGMQWPPHPSLDEGTRLASLWFLETLFGDVVYYFCSFQQNFAMESHDTSTEADEFLLFEVDSFLDAHTELGCRDFFRQFFHTELFRNFMLAQHMQFSAPDTTEAVEMQQTNEDAKKSTSLDPDAFI